MQPTFFATPCNLISINYIPAIFSIHLAKILNIFFMRQVLNKLFYSSEDKTTKSNVHIRLRSTVTTDGPQYVTLRRQRPTTTTTSTTEK